MELRARRHDVLLEHWQFRQCFHTAEGGGGDGVEALMWPGVKPRYRAAIDEGGELAEGVAQRRADGRHTQHDVEVATAALHKKVEDLGGTASAFGVSGSGSD
jgi:hypothetical protein